MPRTAARLPALLLALALALSARAAAAIPGPYDPAPLMAKADPSGSGPFTFVVFGDSYARPVLDDLLKMVAARPPTFAVTGGDMVSRGADDDDWQTLAERAGWFLQKIPTWPVIGNHELAGDRAKGEQSFRQFYALSDPSYSFVFRNSKFIVLNHEGSPAPNSQVAFLRRELRDHDKYAHVFVFRHEPFYTVGSKSKAEVPNQATAMTKLFEQYRVTAVFSGHDHTYYRTRRNGVDYIIAGVSGAGVYSLERLQEQRPGDAYMGVLTHPDRFLLHVPGRPDVSLPEKDSSPDKWLFAVFVHVNGAQVTAETISMQGEIWDRFELARPPEAGKPQAGSG
jgi:hypothetical protein